MLDADSWVLMTFMRKGDGDAWEKMRRIEKQGNK